MDDAGFAGTGKMAPKPAAVQHWISFSANVNKPLAEVVDERAPELLEWQSQLETVASTYARRKQSANCMDYDDLLIQWGRLLREFPEQRASLGKTFQHILIDEMQDTNAVQVDVVEAIAAAGPGNLTAVGDDAQSIYRFRGADYDNILRFPERHPVAKIFHLDINYRSTPQIVAFTRASIAHNQTGYPKELISARPNGTLPLVVATQDAYEEAAFICQEILEAREKGLELGQIAVLYRNHHDSILIQGELLRAASRTRCGVGYGSSNRVTSRMSSPFSGSSSTRATRRPGDGCSSSCRASVRRRRPQSSISSHGATNPSRRSRRPSRCRCCRRRARASSPGSSATYDSSGAPTRGEIRPPRSPRSSGRIPGYGQEEVRAPG